MGSGPDTAGMSLSRRSFLLGAGLVAAARFPVRQWCGVRPCADVDLANGHQVRVYGATRHYPAGEILIPSVWLEQRLTVASALTYWLRPSWQLFPADEVRGPLSLEEFEAYGAIDAVEVQKNASHVALSYLGVPSHMSGAGFLVEESERPVFRPGDLIVAVDGRPVLQLADLLSALAAHPPAVPELTVAFQRSSSSPLQEPTTTVTVPSEESLGVTGSTCRLQFQSEVLVSFEFSPASMGASCGLGMALGAIDVLTPGSLTGGLRVGVTGALDASGRVLPVVGVADKAQSLQAAGADLFLCPRGVSLDTSLPTVQVDTIADAVAACVEAGGTPPTL